MAGLTPLSLGCFALGETLLEAAGWVIPGGTSFGTTYLHQDTAGNGSTYSLGLSSNTTLTNTFDPTAARHIAFFVRMGNDSAGYVRIRLYYGGSVQARIDLRQGSGTSTIYRGDGTTSLATNATPLVLESEHYVEIEANIDNSGRIRVWLDRADDSAPYMDTGAAIDTQAGASAGFDQVGFYAEATPTSVISDVVVLSSTDGRAPYELFLIALRPDGDGGTTDLTPSTGVTNYGTVDETTPSTADYNETTVAGQLDRYTYGSLPYSPQYIGCVSAWAYCARDGAITQARTTIKSSSSTSDGTYVTLGAAGAYSTVWDVYNVDPATSAEWLESAVNAVEAGPQFN